jgi:2,3-bisphosphoglycerate-independent phosphoglycerate mutase
MNVNRRPVALIVLDGWGEAPAGYPKKFNSIAQANLPTFHALLERYPHTLIQASGNAVGLPEGVMGNSEVGHMNMGAGRIIWQTITRIDKAVQVDDFSSIEPLSAAIAAVKGGKRLHLMGLCSNGAVHSVDRHYFALLRLAKKAGLKGDQVAMHCFTDGRDTPPREGAGHIAAIQSWMQENGCGVIATVIGRYYAMDRDQRWDRTQLAYDAMVHGRGIKENDPVQAVQNAYAEGETDEFIKPRVITRPGGEPVAEIADGDHVICFNYRADRVRQITRALTEPNFSEFERQPVKIQLVTMTEYIQGLDARIAFPPQYVENSLGEVFSKLGKTQLRIAETEKYPHVSFFFSGGKEKAFPGEKRVLIPSRRDVATYDMKPEMSAPEIAKALIDEIRDPNFDLIINNFANADMVGHSGNIPATIRACEYVDEALKGVLEEIRRVGGTAIVTADHGNAEQMWDNVTDSPQTQHTTNPVPLILMDEQLTGTKLREGGRLCDIAPTILQLLNLQPPAEMDGVSLLGN